MALAGNIGVDVDLSIRDQPSLVLFGEDQGRYVVDRVRTHRAFVGRLRANVGTVVGVANSAKSIGSIDRCIAGSRLSRVPLADLRAAHEGFFPKLMGADSAFGLK